MVALNQTVTIVNKGGKIVSTSKHLVNVFTEAKSAYNERKAEIKAQRKSEHESREREREAREQLGTLDLDEEDDNGRRLERCSNTNTRAVRRKPVPAARPPVERGISDSFYSNDSRAPRRRGSRSPSRLGHEPVPGDEPRVGELMRRNTDGMQLHSTFHSRPRRASADEIDMDLAYGELPPPLPEPRLQDEMELRSKMNYLQRLLDEGNCVQHSVTAIIDNLQKNPEALAAVALTLAEISNLAAKMAPGALAAMKGSFPAILALLASPQFAIAAGVGVGVTIIALGGYKIIKKIRAKNEERSMLLEAGLEADREGETPEGDADQLRELDRIEKWRRGIADAGAESSGTSVEGEFITPIATRTLLEEGKLTEADLKPMGDDNNKAAKKSRKKTRSEVSSGSQGRRRMRSSSSRSSSGGGGDKGSTVKAKREKSLLKSLFKGYS